MIRRSAHKLLHAPWRQRWMADTVALALASLVLPRIGERVKLDSWPGFALVLVATTAMLLGASWAVIPPPERSTDGEPEAVGPAALSESLAPEVPASQARV